MFFHNDLYTHTQIQKKVKSLKVIDLIDQKGGWGQNHFHSGYVSLITMMKGKRVETSVVNVLKQIILSSYIKITG